MKNSHKIISVILFIAVIMIALGLVRCPIVEKGVDIGNKNTYIYNTETSKGCFMNPIECNGFADLPYSMGFFYGYNMGKETELRTIPEFPGYFVNDVGEIWSSQKHPISNKSGRVKKLKQHETGGYFAVSLKSGGVFKHKKVARLVINAPPNKQVDHKDQDKTNNNINNLRLCTHTQNHMNIKKQIGNFTSKYKGAQSLVMFFE